MSRIELAPEVREDFDRILDHLDQHRVGSPAERIRAIIEAVGVLETNPLIGRPAEKGKREPVIGRGPRDTWPCTVMSPESTPSSCWR